MKKIIKFILGLIYYACLLTIVSYMAIVFMQMWFGLFYHPQPSCPSKWPETKPVWGTWEDYIKSPEGKATMERDGSFNIYYATTSAEIAWKTGQIFYSDKVQIGTATDTDAITHNKMVDQCLIAQGRF